MKKKTEETIVLIAVCIVIAICAAFGIHQYLELREIDKQTINTQTK